MNKFTIFAAAIALFSFTGTNAAETSEPKDFNIIGNGREVKSSAERSTRTVSVKEKYSAIKVSQGITVNLTNGEGPLTASISGPTNVVDLTAIEVDNNTLIVKFKENISLKGENVIVDIKGMIPDSFHGSAGGILNVNSSVKSDGEVSVNVSSGATVNLNKTVSGSDIEIAASSGAFINMNNKATAAECTVDTSTGAGIKIAEITTDYIRLKASTGGTAKISGKANVASAKASLGGEIDCRKLTVNNYKSVKTSLGGEILRQKAI